MCRLDANPFAPCSSPHTTEELPVGMRTHTFEVRATDLAGNPDPIAALSPRFVVNAGLGAVHRAAIIQADVVRRGLLRISVPPGQLVRLPRTRIACPATPPSCSVTTRARRVRAPVRVRSAATTAIAIGSSSYAIAAGSKARVRLKLTTWALQRLKSGRRLIIAVKVTARHGSATRDRTIAVRLRFTKGKPTRK